MSTEYYTGVGFITAKAKLLATCGNRFAFEAPERPRYNPEGQEFLIRHLESKGYILCISEYRDPRDYDKFLPAISTVLPPVGTLTFERFGGNRVYRFVPWIEKTLGVRVMSEIGLPWELDQ